MKLCNELEKHSTCQRRAWNGDGSKKLCDFGGSFQSCFYKPNFINFKIIKDDVIMYIGDIESAGQFKTKAEWIEHFGHDDFQAECDELWHTAGIKISEIDLESILDNVSESEEMYDDWYSDVLYDCKKDPIIEAGFKRINEILSKYPTYMEDKKVVFD